jgi:hypothetical protein
MVFSELQDKYKQWKYTLIQNLSLNLYVRD